MSNLFDTIARAITSLGAVILVMLLTITGMIFFSHTLFSGVFPETMSHWEKLTATWVLALGWEFTVLITTCNTRHISKQIPVVMAVCSGVIVLFFIQAFDPGQSWLTIVQRWFVGILVATINYIYAELFYAKWQERQQEQQSPTTLNDLQQTVDDFQRLLDERERTMNEAESTLNSLRAVLNQKESELNEHRQVRRRFESELTCPHCGVVHESFGSLHAHKGHCSHNPRRQRRTNPTRDVLNEPSLNLSAEG